MTVTSAEAEQPDDRVLTDLDVHALVIRDRFDEFTTII